MWGSCQWVQLPQNALTRSKAPIQRRKYNLACVARNLRFREREHGAFIVRLNMNPEEMADYERQSQELRLDLKKWETEWAKRHEGKKPGRGDIKHNPDIGSYHLVPAAG